MADYDSYYGNDVTVVYHTVDEDVGPQGFQYIKYSLDVWLGYPLAIVLNLMLFIKFVRTPKIKGEPWRWLIANTSFIAFLFSLLLLNGYIEYTYSVPYLTSSALCPAVVLGHMVLAYMYVIFNFLVIIERFHALRLGKEDGGFGKKAAILCLVLFWILGTIVIILAYAIEPLRNGWTITGNYRGICYLHYSTVQMFMKLALWAFTAPAFIIVFIGTLVLRNRKTTSPAMNESNVKPTLAASSLGFFLMIIYLTLNVLPLMLSTLFGSPLIHLLTSTLLLLHLIAFPVIWLVTWSKNGDISFKCCKGNDDEEKQLLQPK